MIIDTFRVLWISLLMLGSSGILTPPAKEASFLGSRPWPLNPDDSSVAAADVSVPVGPLLIPLSSLSADGSGLEVVRQLLSFLAHIFGIAGVLPATRRTHPETVGS